MTIRGGRIEGGVCCVLSKVLRLCGWLPFNRFAPQRLLPSEKGR